jgi:hypothetical protein
MRRCLVFSLTLMILTLVLAIPAAAAVLPWQSVVGPMPATVGSGFGDTNNMATTISIVYGDRLYAAVLNGTTGAQMWRTADGVTWMQINTSGFGDANNPTIDRLAVFGGDLYAGTKNGFTGTQIWRFDGTSWAQVNTSGFGDPNNTINQSLTVYSGDLYAGTFNKTTGTEIWRSTDGTTWTNVVGPSGVVPSGFGNVNNQATESLTVFKGLLYAGTLNTTDGTQIWRYDGTTWTQVNANGFGNPANNVTLRSMTVFGNYLYAGTGYGGITQVWRSSDGTNWTNVVGPGGAIAAGFGNAKNWVTHDLTVFGDYLYASTGDAGQVWRSPDGLMWTQTNTDGFGDTTNTGVFSLTVFGDYLYAGTRKRNAQSGGTQIWRLQGESQPQPTTTLPFTGGDFPSPNSPNRPGIAWLIVLSGLGALVFAANVRARRTPA